MNLLFFQDQIELVNMFVNIIIIIFEFYLFSFFGFIIDTAYRTWENKKIVMGNYLYPVPICPIYGLGALFLSFYFKYSSPGNLYLSFFMAASVLILLELFGAIFCKKVLKAVLWDYSKKKLNYKGYIDLTHSLWWLILVVFFYYFIFPSIIVLEEQLRYILL